MYVLRVDFCLDKEAYNHIDSSAFFKAEKEGDACSLVLVLETCYVVLHSRTVNTVWLRAVL